MNRSLCCHLILQSPLLRVMKLQLFQSIQVVARKPARKPHPNSASMSSLHSYHASSSPCWEPISFTPFGFNLTVFLLASEVRPTAHLIKIVRTRTLYLQRIVNENPYQEAATEAKVLELSKRVEELESRLIAESNGAENASAGKNTTAVSADIRRSLQPDLDALNRAVRRYEKKATLQTMQTEARLVDLEARLSDVLSLAAAAQSGQRSINELIDIMFNWIWAALLLPIQMIWGLLSLPATAAGRILGFGKGKLRAVDGGRGKKDGKYVGHGRPVGERLQGRGMKKI
jgi:hypothetical protein